MSQKNPISMSSIAMKKTSSNFLSHNRIVQDKMHKVVAKARLENSNGIENILRHKTQT